MDPLASTSDAMASPNSQEASIPNQPPITADVSHDLMEIFRRRRDTKVVGAIEPPRNDKEHDRDVLSDRDMERFTISPKNDTEDNHSIKAKTTDDQHGRSKQFKFDKAAKRWDPFGPGSPPDDEWFVTDPEILSEDDPAYLCEMCRHLDFAALFTKREVLGGKGPSKPMQISIDGLWKVMQEDGNSCAFCGLLRRKIVEGGRISHMSDDDIRGRELTFYIGVLDEGSEYAPRLEVELAWTGRIIERFVVHKVQDNPQQPLAGRLVQQDRADMDRLRQWLQVCEGTHPSLENALDLGMASLRVIDTEELRVREVDMPCRYACLSYVWGTGSQTQYTIATRESLETPRALEKVDLPQTIRDAIKVTIEAGLRYLWIDALCILQDDLMDKAKIISKIGPIYGGATLTIVAATNTDPDEGLPGMGTAHRFVAQDTARINGLTLAVGLHDPRQPIPDMDGSVWSSRAWTFQERALSARSVYFTRSQMVFKCVHSAIVLEETVPVPDIAFRHLPVQDHAMRDLMMLIWSHPSLSRFENKGFSTHGEDEQVMLSGNVDMEAWHKMSQKEKREIAPVFDLKVEAPRDFMGSIGDTDGSTPWDMYSRAVEDYTKRKLTYESDAVNAFAGVEHIVRRGMNTKFWFGLPSFAMEQALLWHAREPLELRTQNNKAIFPSWSWAGWRGQVFYRGRGWKNSVLWEPVTMVRWHVRETKQQIVDGFKAAKERTEEEVQAFMEEISSVTLFLRELSAYTLRHVDTKGKDGWVVNHDEEYNRHIYTHDAYPGVRFSYPVDLPGQIIEDRPDMYAVPNGVLLFKAFAVPIIPCNMKETTFKMEIEDRFLQLGINDESRSSNYRPPWHRIIYHQGYRAGFLTLNNSECLPADGDGCEYHLAAITLGSLPHVPPPMRGWDEYWNMEPRELQQMFFDGEWRSGPSKLRVPRETAEPSTANQNEDGNPHWDQGRFGGVAVFDVYEVLLLMMVNGVSWRLGVGRVSYCAFSAARPQEMLVTLA